MSMFTRVGATVCFLLAYTVSVLAQGGPEAADPSTTPVQWYTSIAGVGAATIAAVAAIKRYLGTREPWSKVPTWVYGVVVAFVLTLLCSQVLKTLPGEFWQLAWQAVYNAAIATGFYEIFGNVKTPLEVSAAKTLDFKGGTRMRRRKPRK